MFKCVMAGVSIGASGSGGEHWVTDLLRLIEVNLVHLEAVDEQAFALGGGWLQLWNQRDSVGVQSDAQQGCANGMRLVAVELTMSLSWRCSMVTLAGMTWGVGCTYCADSAVMVASVMRSLGVGSGMVGRSENREDAACELKGRTRDGWR